MKDALRTACGVAVVLGFIYSQRPDRGPIQQAYHLTLIVGGLAGLLSLEILRRGSKKRREVASSPPDESVPPDSFSAAPLPKPVAERPQRAAWRGSSASDRWGLLIIAVVIVAVGIAVVLGRRP
jgi:hypothetical protein